ncbi:MAG: two-component system sensor histidine kinase NtrB [Desulfobacteraceae bacterium]
MGSIDATGSPGERNGRDHSVFMEDCDLARAWLASILEHSEEVIFLVNETGRLVSFSRGGEKRLGYPKAEIIGYPAHRIVHDVTSFQNGLRTCREQGTASLPEFSFRKRTGELETLDLFLIRMPHERQNPKAILGIGKEIDCKKRLEDDLTRVDRLAELGRAASGIAHDINNPVAVIGEISGWMEVLISDAPGLRPEEREELKKAVRDIQKQTGRCRAVTRQVLNFARESRSEKRSVDLHKILKNTVQFLRSETLTDNIHIRLDLMEALPPLDSEPEKLEQVFINLLSNAVYAVKEKREAGGQIRVQTARLEDLIQVTISDNGSGIPKEMHHKIFDLFYTTKPSGKGTGLGLPICKRIIESLGGEISFASEPGMGTDFFVRLPIS